MLNAKFRAKSDLSNDEMDILSIPHTDGWVYGYLAGGWMLGDILEGGEEYIQPEWWVSVQEGTRGQCTGVKDKCGVEVYQGDIIEYKTIYEWDKNPIKRQEIVFEHGSFSTPSTTLDLSRAKVIGNIYDNKDLLD